ncbi:MAG: hypothetical protein V3U14_12865 [candidate division NC10 bacterium]
MNFTDPKPFNTAVDTYTVQVFDEVDWDCLVAMYGLRIMACRGAQQRLFFEG